MSDTLVLHFGVYPLGEAPAEFDEHDDQTVSKDVWFKTLVGPVNVQIDGSWKCWGTADQDSDGDDSLHLWMYVSPTVSTSIYGIVHDEIDRLARESGSRALDYAILTDEDWSDVVAVYTFVGGTHRHEVREA